MEVENKVMTVIVSNTVRDIVQTSNSLGIKREDIVSILRENGQFILIYFK